MQTEQFKPFEVTRSDAEVIERQFTRLLVGCCLGELTAVECRSTLMARSGCYLWVMRLESAQFKIYVGQTNSIQKRVTDYTVGFQIHSPNDYKLRFFEELMREAFPLATLDLYFAAAPVEQCRDRENEFVRQFRPLINTLPPANEEERELIRQAFRAYYQSSVKRHLDRDI